jgi:hypothetical protein
MLATWHARSAAPECATVVAQSCASLLTPELLVPAEHGDWDGVVSRVDAESLPCAFWQLITEHMAIWCACARSCRRLLGAWQCDSRALPHRSTLVSADTLASALAVLVKTAHSGCARTAGGDDSDTVHITLQACSRQLFADAAFYELAEVRHALPGVLLAELGAAQQRIARACGSKACQQRVDQLLAQTESGDTAGLLAASQENAGDERAAPAPGVREAVSQSLELVALLGWIPPPYFMPPLLWQVVNELTRMERLLLCALSTSVPDCYSQACDTLRVLRTVLARLLAAGGTDVTCKWSGDAHVKWLLGSLHVLAVLASGAHVETDVDARWQQFEASAVQSGALLGQLLRSMAGLPAHKLEAVLSAVYAFCHDLPALASACAAAEPLDAKPTSRFVPRTVALQQRSPKVKARVHAARARPTRAHADARAHPSSLARARSPTPLCACWAERSSQMRC